MRWVRSLARRDLDSTQAEALVAGGFDRLHDGLVSGWFVCPSCGPAPRPTPEVLVDGHTIAATGAFTSRGDVPGGLGFLFRFAPQGTAGAGIRVRCPVHPEQGLDVEAEQATWRVPALGAIESSTWPHVTGWLALLDSGVGVATLEVDDHAAIALRLTVRRADVQSYLGTSGVGGFDVDLGSILGHALVDGTGIRLVANGSVLAEATLRESPLGPQGASCLARRVEGSLDTKTLTRLRQRFLNAEVSAPRDWRDLLALLGLEDHTAETEQWAAYLTHQGCTSQQIATWLSIRATQRLGVPALNSLPASLDNAIRTGDVPQPVLAWTGGVIGVSYDSEDLRQSWRPPVSSLAIDKVAVAGLLHHRSGLGQNARNSLEALDVAGIHGCPVPFFAAPGGWNPELGPTREATRSLEDHAVLLHLPIDTVIPSLSAQPALLCTDRLIGYFMWETETVPRQFRRALELVDEIWTATKFVAEALRTLTDTPVYVTGHAVDTHRAARLDRSEFGISDADFVVHYAFDANSTVARKNPNGAIDAFHKAFGRDPMAIFLLKVRNMQQVVELARVGDPHARGLLERLDSDPAIRVVTGEHDHAFALGLISMADCFLSLHRSEGFGYGIAEAMDLGTHVIATDYSGSCDLATEQTAWLVPYDRTEVAPGEYFFWEPGMSWAEPDIDSAAMILQTVRDGTDWGLDAARTHVARSASITSLSARYLSRLSKAPS